jgi:hypothetical protein
MTRLTTGWTGCFVWFPDQGTLYIFRVKHSEGDLQGLGEVQSVGRDMQHNWTVAHLPRPRPRSDANDLSISLVHSVVDHADDNPLSNTEATDLKYACTNEKPVQQKNETLLSERSKSCRRWTWIAPTIQHPSCLGVGAMSYVWWDMILIPRLPIDSPYARFI